MSIKPMPEEQKAKQAYFLKGSINNFEQEAERAKKITKMLNESTIVLEQELEGTETIRKLYQNYSPSKADKIGLKTASKLFKGLEKAVERLEWYAKYHRQLMEGIKGEREEIFKLL